MPTVVFGPHPTGLVLFGVHIPLLNTEVLRADQGAIPQSLTIRGFGPTGQTNSCSVSNGETMTVNGIAGINATYIVNDCRNVPASGQVPEQFIFRISIRAEGSASIPGVPIPIPVNLQVDSFEVLLATDNSVNDQLRVGISPK